MDVSKHGKAEMIRVRKGNPFDVFIQQMTQIVRETNDETILVEEAEQRLGKLLQSSDWLSQEKRVPCETTYARHSLYEDPQDKFEIIALIWQPGQYTALHDHDGTWGVEGVLTGQMRVTSFLHMGKESSNLARLRETGVVRIGPEDTGKLLPPADCHILEQQGEETAITIHVYGKKLKKLKVFEKTDEPDLYSVHEQGVNYTATS